MEADSAGDDRGLIMRWMERMGNKTERPRFIKLEGVIRVSREDRHYTNELVVNTNSIQLVYNIESLKPGGGRNYYIVLNGGREFEITKRAYELVQDKLLT